MKKHILALVAALALAGCGMQSSDKPAAVSDEPSVPVAVVDAPALVAEQKVLRIYNWPEYLSDGILDAFEIETGIRVEYTTFDTAKEMDERIRTGTSGFDIVVPNTTFAAGLIKDDLLRPLDKSKIPNLKNLNEGLMKIVDAKDPGTKHLVPWAWSFTTVGINKTKVERVLGNKMPDNPWDLVFNPSYTSRLSAACGMSWIDSAADIYPVALAYMGKNPYSTNPADYEAVNTMLAKVRPHIKSFEPAVVNVLADGNACVVIGWADDINIAQERASEFNKPYVMQAFVPKNGLVFIDTMGITKESKNVDAAHAFINFYLGAEIAAGQTNEMFYATGNNAALPLVRPEQVRNPSIFVSAEALSGMIPPGNFTDAVSERINALFEKFKQ